MSGFKIVKKQTVLNTSEINKRIGQNNSNENGTHIDLTNNKRDLKFGKKQETKAQQMLKNLTPMTHPQARSKASVEKNQKIAEIKSQHIPDELQPLFQLNKNHTLISKFKAFMISQQILQSANFQQQLDSIIREVDENLAFFDGKQFVDYLAQITDQNNSSTFRKNELSLQIVEGSSSSFIQRFTLEICKAVFQMESRKIQGNGSHQYLFTAQLQGKNIYGEKVKYQTGTIDLKYILQLYLNAAISLDQGTKEEQLRKLWRCLGLDTMNQQGSAIPNNLIDLKILSYKIQRLNGLALVNKHQGTHSSFSQISVINNQTLPLFLKAEKSIFAISRARIQYLGQNIPIFKFQHSLFEALISAIHPEEVTREGVDQTTDLRPKDILRHESFLYHKFQEFSQSDLLRPLLTFSQSGSTDEFLTYFNSLAPESSQYAKFKLCLYDINQRRFVNELPAMDSGFRKAFLVHYNGFVFGTNHAKMFTIREREIGLHQDDQDSSDRSDSEEQKFSSKSKEEDSVSIRIEEDDDENGSQEVDSQSIMLDSDDDEGIGKIGGGGKSVISEVDMRTSFIMTSNINGGRGNRRKKLLSQLPKNVGKLSSTSGLLSLKIEFNNNQVKRLLCYGFFPWITQNNSQTNQNLLKIFEGDRSHFHFMTWLLQSVINYRKDSRSHSRFVNIFTLNGSSKELPFLLDALVAIVGRDAHFIGDMQKLKLVWFENIRFFDLSNYFDGKSFNYFKVKWLTNAEQKLSLAKTAGQDRQLYKVLLIFEIVYGFTEELQSIAFNNGKNFYDLSFHGQASASSLALSIFQYLFLDKQHIKGTGDIEIYDKEKASLKGPYFTINRLGRPVHECQQMNLYEIKHAMAACFKDFPIPFEYTKRKEVQIDFNFETLRYQYSYKQQSQLDIWDVDTGYQFKLQYSSLYKVDKLCKKKYALILPEQTSFGLNYTTDTMTDQYIWGAELIHAIIENGRSNSVIKSFSISEEISYLQGKVFSHFVTEIWDKYRLAQSRCQKDILEMILDSFHSKFSQKFFSVQSIIHINDLHLMKQTSFKSDQAIHKLYELCHPYYYIEYYPQGSDHLQQICSLVRITSYANACHRIKQYQTLKQFDGQESMDSILYLDHQYLLLNNKQIHDPMLQNMKLPMSVKLTQNIDTQIGKYHLILQSSPEEPEITKYLEYFKSKESQIEELSRVKMESNPMIMKNFGYYKLMVKSTMGESFNLTDEQIVDNYVKLILSDPSSLYQLAPQVELPSKAKHSQKHTLHSQLQDKPATHLFGVTPQQAQDLKKLLIKAIDASIVPPQQQQAPQQPTTSEVVPRQFDKVILENPDLFREMLTEAKLRFEGQFQRQVHEGGASSRYAGFTDSIQPSDLQQDTASNFVRLRKEETSEEDEEQIEKLMSQAELALAVQCGEDSSQGSVIPRNLAKSSNGNLVSEFFSQTNTR